METNTELLNRIEAHIKGRLAVAESRAASSELYEGKKIAYTSILGFVNSLRTDLAATTAENTEDDAHRKWILEYLYDGLCKADEQFKDHFKAAIAWLETQKEQQPAGWSEDDEKKIIFLERLIMHNVPEGQYGWVDGNKGGFVTKQEAISMLKSLRPQPQRKPIAFEHRILGRVDISSCCD